MPYNTSENRRRLFVPLKSEHYRAFESGKKKWELRGAARQFNPTKLYIGRTVELRRGYSTDDSLWGEIEDVITFNEIEAVPESIDHQKIVPDSSREEFIEGAKELLGKYDKYVAFKVNLDAVNER